MPRFLQPLRLLFPVVLVALFLFSHNADAQVVVTQGVGGNLCVGSGYTTLSNIVLSENLTTDFAASGPNTLILTAPANFEFNNLAAPPNISVSGAGISSSGASFSSATSLTISIALFGAHVATVNSITIAGLSVQAVTTATSSSAITYGGTLAMNGISAGSTSLADLSSNDPPSTSVAGPNQQNCNSGNFTLAANSPGTGTGLWTVTTGTASIVTTNSPTSSVTGVPVGTSATLQWSISNGTCTPSTSTVVLTNNAPVTVAAAGSDINQCGNGNFTLSGNVPGTGTGAWTVAAGSAFVTNTSLATSTVTGVPVGTSATLRWTITNGNCTSSDDVVLTNNANPTPVITGINAVCAGAAGLVYSTPAVVGNTYSWSISGGSITSGVGTNSVTVTWAAAGTGTLTVTETITATGCVVTTGNYNVTINALPTPVISGTATVCANVTGQIYSTPSVGGHSYVWAISGGLITAGAGTSSVTVTWGSAGTGSLTVDETITATGCTVTTSVYNVTINALPAPAITGLNVVCSGAIGVGYSTPLVAGHTYVWAISGGSITAGAGTNAITVSWGAAGTGTLSVTETITATGCLVSTGNFNVTVNLPPVPVVGGLNTVCAGASGVNYSTPLVGGHSYVWTISGGVITAGAGSNSVTVSWGGAGTGTLTVAETITTSGCTVTTGNYSVTINALPTPVVSGLNTVCANVTGQVYSTPLVAGHTYVWTIGGGSITSGAGTNAVTVSWGAAGTGTLTVAETITATGCAVTTGNYNVTINALPTPLVSGTATVCAGVSGQIYSTPNVGGHSYVWTISGGVITAGAGSNSVTVSWGGAGTGTLTVAETITTSGCTVTTGNYIVTINALPTPVVSGLNTVCANVTGQVYSTPLVAGHTYVWTIGGGSITSGAGTNAVTVSWGAAGTGTLTVAETITATGCAVTTGNYNVTINALPTPLVSGTATVCAGVSGQIYSTPNVGGHSYVWTISGGVITAGAGSNSVTVSWGGAGTGTLTVAETITTSGCTVTTGNYSVTINALPTPVVSGLNTVCANVTGQVYSTPLVAGHTYVWTIGGGSITSGAGTNAVTVSWGAAGTGTLTVAETITATGCAVTTGNYNVTINALPTPLVSGTATVCAGVSGQIYSTPNVGGHSYVWTISGGVITAGAGSNSVTVSWGGAGTGTLTVAETITTSGCTVTTGNYTVTINALPTPVVSGLNTVCANVTGQVYSTPLVAGHTYVWTIGGGSITSGAGTNAVTVSWGAAGTGTLTVAETITATGCAVTTGNYNVTINALPTPLVSGTATVCAGVSGQIYSTPNVGGHSYVWTISGGVITAGAGSNSVTVSWGGAGTGTLTVAETITTSGCTVTTGNYSVTINALPTPVVSGLNTVCANVTGQVYSTPLVAGHTYVWTIGGGSITSGAGTNAVTVSWGAAGTGTLTVAETITATGCAVTTGNYNVTINALPTPLVSGTATVCAGVSGQIYSTPNVGGHSYVWTISGGVITAGAGSNSVTVSWGGAGTGTLTVAETITTSGCTVTTGNYSVTINALPTPVVSGLNTVCANVTGQVYSTPLVAGHTYVWTIGGGSITSGAGTNAVTVSWGAAGTGTLTVAETITATGCAVTTGNYNVTINALPTPLVSGTATVCAGVSGQIYSTPNVGGHSYVWTISGGVITAGAGSNSVTVSWGGAGTGTLTVAETITTSGCTVTTGNYSVTINALPTPVVSGLNTVCANVTGQVYSTPLVAGHTYVWTIGGGSITSGAGTNAVTVSWGAAGTGTLTVAETITATGCAVTTGNYNVTINALPTPLVSGTATVCAGVSGQIYSTPNVGGHSYVWTISGGVITAGAGSNSVTVSWGGAGTGTLTVAETITTSGCTVTTGNYSVTINALPTPVVSGLNTVCANVTGQVYSTPLVAGHTYVWTIGGGSITSGAGTNAVTVSWGAAGTGTLTVAETITATGCAVTTGNYNVTINALPTPLVSGTATVCAGVSGQIYSTPNVGGHSYVWTISGGVITAGAGSNSVTVSWGGAGTGTLTVAETITTSGCTVTTGNYTVTINALPTPSISGLNAVCENVTGKVYSTPGIAGNSYSWLIIGGIITSGAGTNAIAVTWGTAGSGTLRLTETVTATGCSVTTPNYDILIRSNPTPAIIGPSPVCEGSTGSFYGTVTVPGDSYTWIISGGTITSGAGTSSIAVTWGASGTGTITLTETTLATGCSTTTPSFPVSISPNPVPVIAGLNTVCAGSIGVVYSTPAVAGNTYGWSITGGSITAGATTNSATVTWGTAGTGSLTLTQTVTATGCAVTTPGFQVTINANPTPVISGSNTICSGTIGVGYSTPATGNAFMWTISGGTISAGAGTNSITVDWGATGTGTLTVVETISGSGCVVTSAPYNVTLTPLPVLTAVSNIVVCSGAAIGPINFTASTGGGETFNWTNSNPAINLAASGSGNSISFVAATNTSASALTATISVTGTKAGCTGPAMVFTTTINPEPVISGTLSTTVCSGQLSGITLITNGTSVTAANYTINSITIAPGLTGNIGNASIGAGKADIAIVNDKYTNLTGAALTAVYNVTPLSVSGCSGSAVNITLTVNPEPVVSGSLNATVCSGQASGITLNTNGTSVGAANYTINSITVAPGLTPFLGNATTGAGKAAGAIVTDKFRNTTNGALTVIYNVTPVSVAPCTGQPVNITLTVNPEPVLTNSLNATVCSGAASGINLTTLVSSAAAAGYTVNSITVAPGLTAAGGNASTGPGQPANSIAGDKFTNLSGGALTVVYNITPVSAAACSGAAVNVTLTVNPEPVVTAVASQAFCPVAAINIPLLSNVAGATLTWTNSNPAIGLPASGTGDINYAAPSNSGPADLVGSITVTATGAGCVSTGANQKSFTITIHPLPVLTAVSNIVVCSGGTVSAINFVASTGGGETFNWTNSNPAINLVAGGSGNIASFTAATNTSAAPLTSTISVTGTKFGCTGPAMAFTLTVNPEPVVSGSLNATVCSGLGSGIALNTNGTSVGASGYTINSITIAPGLTAGGGNATTGSGKAANAIANDKYTNVTGGALTAVYNVTPLSAAGCVGVSVNITLTVNPEPVVSSSLDATVCSGLVSGITLNTNGTSIGASSYTINSITVAPGLTPVSGNSTTGSGQAANAIVNDKFTNVTAGGLTVVYNVTPLSGSSCFGSSKNITLTVNPNPVMSTTLNATVCSGQVSGITLNTNGTSIAAASYTINSITIAPGLTAAGGNATTGSGQAANAIVNDKFTNVTSSVLTVVYNVTPVSAGPCTGAARNITLTVNPEPVVSSSLNATVCSGQLSGITLNTNGTSVAAATYTINSIMVAPGLTPGGTNATTGSGLAASAIVNDRFTNITNGVLTVVYNVTPLSAAGCVGSAQSITLTVNPEPVVSSTLNATVCSGLASGIVLNTNGSSVAASSYTINSISVASGLTPLSGNVTPGAGKAAGAIASDKFVNLTNGALAVVYSVAAVSGVPCTGSPVTITLTISPEPVISNSLNTTVCSGGASGITLATNGTSIGASSYTINSITVASGLTPAGGNTASGAGKAASAIANDKFTNVTNVPLTVVYNVTPISGSACTGAPINITLTVNPEPVVSGSLNATVCSGLGSGIALNTNGTSVGASGYTINSITIAPGLTAGGGNATTGAGKAANAIANDKYTNVTGGALTAVYNVTPLSAAGCVGVSVNITLTVNPEPVVSSSLDATVCSGLVSGITLNTNGTSIGASSYTINSITVAPGLTPVSGNSTTGSGQAANAIVNDKFTNVTAGGLTVVYNVTPLSGSSCFGSSKNITLTVNPNPVMSTTLNATVCSGQVSGITLNTNGTSIAAASYTINSITIAPGLTAAGGNATTGSGQAANAIVNDKFTNVTSSVLTVVYNVTPVSAGPCTGAARNITLTVNPEPVVSSSLNATVCSGQLSGITLNTNGTSVAAATYTINSITVAPGLTPSGSNVTIGPNKAANAVFSDKFTNVSNAALTVVYNVTAVSSSGCTGSGQTITLTINPEPVVSSTLNATVCSGLASGIVLNTNGSSVAASSYTINSISVAPGLSTTIGNATQGPGKGVNAISSDKFVNTTNAPLTVVYNISAVSATPCTGASVNVVLTINPEPVVATGLGTTVCSGLASGIVLNTSATSTAASSYNINSINIAPGLTPLAGNSVPGAGLGAGAISSDRFTNVTSSQLAVVYSISAVSAASCTGATRNITLTINPEPVISSTLNTAVCSNNISGVTLIVSATSVAAASYTINSITVAPGLSPSGSNATAGAGKPANAILNDVFTNTTSNPLTVVYLVKPVSAAGCIGASMTITLTVNPQPVGIAASKTICSGSSVGVDLQANVNGVNGVASTFTWVAQAPINPNLSGASTTSQSTSFVNDILLNTSPAFSAQSQVYLVQPRGTNGCLGTSFTITIVVNHEAVISAGPDKTICQNTLSPQIDGVATFPATGSIWSSSSTGTFSPSPNNNPLVNYTFAAADLVTPPVLTITSGDPDGPGGPCPIVLDQMTLKINLLPQPFFFYTGLPPFTPPALPSIPQNYSAFTVLVNAHSSGGTFSISPGSGLLGTYIGADGNDHAELVPSAASLGLNSIVYSYTDPVTHCSNSTPLHGNDIIINPVTFVDFALDLPAHVNASGNYQICSDVSSVHLTGFPDPNTGHSPYTRFAFDSTGYTGSTKPIISQDGAGQWYIQTNGLKSDTYNIIYYFENSFGAQTQKERAIEVFASPIASMIVGSHCLDSAIQYTDNSTFVQAGANPPAAPTINQWTWNFGDGNQMVGTPAPSHNYAKPNVYSASLTVVTKSPQLCSSTTNQIVRIGAKPTVDFDWTAICYGDSTKFADLTVVPSPSVVSSYTWDFGDGTVPVSGPSGLAIPAGQSASGLYNSPHHKYDSAKRRKVILSVVTNDGCIASVVKDQFTLNLKTIQPMASSAYFEDFEPAAGKLPGNGWQRESKTIPPDSTTNSWTWTQPAGKLINMASSGTKAWWTGLHVPATGDSTNYFKNEQTVVNGPCFDLSQLKRPMVSIDYWVDTQRDFDGAVLQYSIDGGFNWENVGLPTQGINWYSAEQIVGNPGKQSIGQYGWTGQTSGWRTARANLDNIKDSTAAKPVSPNPRRQVRLRVAFASDATNPPQTLFDGFAFDNVYVGEKRKFVLVEEFTNSSDPGSGFADLSLDGLYNKSIADRGIADFYDIRYHISNPGTDLLNQQNPVDPAARALFVGVTKPPFEVMDGRLDAIFTGNPNMINAVELDRRSLTDPKFDLVLTNSVTNNKLDFSLDIVADTTFASPVIAQISLVEKTVGIHHNVLRKQLLTPGGQSINMTWAGPIPPAIPGQKLTISQTAIDVSNVPVANPDSLFLIAYVQDKNTKEVYQSTYSKVGTLIGGTITGIDPAVIGAQAVQIYPNPASDHFTFSLPAYLEPGYVWSIIDQRGVTVLTGDFEGAVDHQQSVSVRGLADGMYIVTVGNPDKPSVYRKLAVVNRN